MTIKRYQLRGILTTINNLKEHDFSIATKYKILKLEDILIKESELTMALITEISDKYGEVVEDGQVRIKEEFAEEVMQQLNEFDHQGILLPDMYFSLDEFDNANLSWDDLKILYPFIKQ